MQIGCAGRFSPPQEAVKIDFFVMSRDFLSVEVENTLAILKEETLIPITVNFYYVAQETPQGEFASRYGYDDIEEDMRQLVIQKYFPGQFWKYLRSRNSDYRNPEWKSHAYWTGLVPEEIDQKVQQEGKTLLRESIQKANQLKINSAPVLYLNGQLYQGNRSLPALAAALSKAVKKEAGIAVSIPDCFSDADCIDPSAKESGRCLQPGTLKASCEFLSISLKIIIPGGAFTHDPRPLQMFLQQSPNLKPAIQNIVWDSPEGKELLERFPGQDLPFYVWGENFGLLDIIPSLRNYQILQSRKETDGKEIYWFSSNFAPPRFYPNRPSQPNHLDLFVMSQCPFGTSAENQILPIARANGITVGLHYIIQEQLSNPSDPDSLTLISLHGSPELEENIRQVCAQKYFPDRHSDYILERNKNFQSTLWQDAASKTLGAESIALIESCSAQEGKTLLLERTRLAKDLGIHTSPTVLWENQHRFNKLEELKNSVAVFSSIEAKQGGCQSQ